MAGSEDFESGVSSEVIRLDLIGKQDESCGLLAGIRLGIFSYLLGGIEGRRILDIGCGAKARGGYDRTAYGDVYEPGFCRLAKIMGVDVVGMDPRIEQKDEKFEAHQASVYRFPDFPLASFDGVLIAALWSDPSPFRKNDEHLRKTQRETYKKVRELLKPRGYSVNVANEYKGSSDEPSRLLTRDEFAGLGFEVIHYFGENETALLGGADLIVLRKP